MAKNRTVGTELTTSYQTVYAAPSQWEANVASITLSNSTTSSATVSMRWYQSDVAAYHTLMSDIIIQPNSIVQITDCLWLKRTEALEASASVGSAITTTVSVREHHGTAA